MLHRHICQLLNISICLVSICRISVCLPVSKDDVLPQDFYIDQNSDEIGEGMVSIGDMVFRKDDVDVQNGLINETARWPNRTVYYTISDTFNGTEINMIEAAFDEYHKRTCIKWVKRGQENDYVNIVNRGAGCWAHLGRLGGNQTLNLGRRCFQRRAPGVPAHEMLHTLGFLHEQARSDRDKYVRILWENIIPGYELNFAKFPNTTITDFGVPYDYSSVMHYTAYHFSKNGKKTIETLVEGAEIGQMVKMSDSDVLKLKRMYKC